jgi:hypothetical protein
VARAVANRIANRSEHRENFQRHSWGIPERGVRRTGCSTSIRENSRSRNSGNTWSADLCLCATDLLSKRTPLEHRRSDRGPTGGCHMPRRYNGAKNQARHTQGNSPSAASTYSPPNAAGILARLQITSTIFSGPPLNGLPKNHNGLPKITTWYP